MSNAVLVALAKSVKDLRAAFVNLSKQPGPQGDPGRDGVDGKDGAEGRNGVDGRNGADGRDGVDGKDGRPGKDGMVGNPGRDGKDGKDGEAGPIGPMPKHEWRGTELRFQLTPKKWGKWVNLKGPAGSSGSVVVQGDGGSGGTPIDPNNIPQVSGVQTGDEMMMVRDGKFVRVKIALSGVPTNAVTVNGSPVTVNGEYVVIES